jgi:tripartite-type tricarboxylate transporter receptor subunit TctC
MKPGRGLGRIAVFCLGCVILFAGSAGSAADYPVRPVRWIVGYPAGGTTDIVARLIGHWLSERLGQQFIIENKPCAGNNIGTEAAINAPPDGYTVLLVNPANAINATLYQKLPFNWVPGYEASAFFGMSVPKGTPADVIDRLNHEINAALADAAMKAKLAELGGMLIPGSPAEFGRTIAEETEKWAKVIKSGGVTLE